MQRNLPLVSSLQLWKREFTQWTKQKGWKLSLLKERDILWSLLDVLTPSQGKQETGYLHGAVMPSWCTLQLRRHLGQNALCGALMTRVYIKTVAERPWRLQSGLKLLRKRWRHPHWSWTPLPLIARKSNLSLFKGLTLRRSSVLAQRKLLELPGHPGHVAICVKIGDIQPGCVNLNQEPPYHLMELNLGDTSRPVQQVTEDDRLRWFYTTHPQLIDYT